MLQTQITEWSVFQGKPGLVEQTPGTVSIEDALTSRDKEVVIAATGALDPTGPGGVHELNPLAVNIALDRAIGNLIGPLDAEYLRMIADEGGAYDFGLAPHRPRIAETVIEQALRYVNSRPC